MLTHAHDHFPTVFERRLRDAAVYLIWLYQKGHSGAAYARQKHKMKPSVSFFVIFMESPPSADIQQGKLEKDNQTAYCLCWICFVFCFSLPFLFSLTISYMYLMYFDNTFLPLYIWHTQNHFKPLKDKIFFRSGLLKYSKYSWSLLLYRNSYF